MIFRQFLLFLTIVMVNSNCSGVSINQALQFERKGVVHLPQAVPTLAQHLTDIESARTRAAIEWLRLPNSDSMQICSLCRVYRARATQMCGSLLARLDDADRHDAQLQSQLAQEFDDCSRYTYTYLDFNSLIVLNLFVCLFFCFLFRR